MQKKKKAKVAQQNGTAFTKERQLGQRDNKIKPYGFKAVGIEGIFIKFQPGLNS